MPTCPAWFDPHPYNKPSVINAIEKEAQDFIFLIVIFC
jgi:hypothetical protein